MDEQRSWGLWLHYGSPSFNQFTADFLVSNRMRLTVWDEEDNAYVFEANLEKSIQATMALGDAYEAVRGY